MDASRPPIILQFSAHHTVAAGHVGSVAPKHLAELPVPLLPATSSGAAEEYYQLYAFPIERLVRLLGGSGGTNASQRVVVLHCQGLFPNRHWKRGMSRILQDLLNVSMVSFQSALHMVPFALCTPSTPAVLLSVFVSASEAQCMVYASGHTLEYTFQCCGFYGEHEAKPTSTGDLRMLQQGWLSTESCLVRAIFHSLELCPVQLRKQAIHNLVFAGTLLVDDFGAKIALKLHEFLTYDYPRDAPSKPEGDNEAVKTTDIASSPIVFTEIPLNRKLMRPLAEHIALVGIRGRYELLPWMGASIWANYWHQHEQDSGAKENQLQWVKMAGAAIPK